MNVPYYTYTTIQMPIYIYTYDLSMYFNLPLYLKTVHIYMQLMYIYKCIYLHMYSHNIYISLRYISTYSTFNQSPRPRHSQPQGTDVRPMSAVERRRRTSSRNLAFRAAPHRKTMGFPKRGNKHVPVSHRIHGTGIFTYMNG